MSSKSVTSDPTEEIVQQNIVNWQSATNPLAPLNEDQLDLVYELEDIIKEEYFGENSNGASEEQAESTKFPVIDSYKAFLKWFTQVEREVDDENLTEFQSYYNKLRNKSENVEKLTNYAKSSNDYLNTLLETHKEVINKTDYLHDLSEELMKQQTVLKEKKEALRKELKYFIKAEDVSEIKDVNSKSFTETLDLVTDSIKELSIRLHYKEARLYKMRNERLLMSLLNEVYNLFNQVVKEASHQISNPDHHDLNAETSYSLYYGKFQTASHKVSTIFSYLEEKREENEIFNNALLDCHKMYLAERLPLLTAAVSKALNEIREQHKTDFSVLFRSCGLFVMKVCQDEANCFCYFFKKYNNNSCEQFEKYLSLLCQNLYDVLRPCIITVNHIEILTELCGILRKEMLNDRILNNDALKKYVEIINQLLEDVEERLVFRTNVFFQHDLLGYTPSPGDLAYPEKLVHMEKIALDFQERSDSRSSDGQDTVNNTFNSFRSYTGNSPADLHGMWYPTVKRTLVCLSRLYFCLDKETFQGLAQEALVICVKTIQKAADLISSRKTKINGLLFQIKHLLIVREQIAPFQVDFTIKEVGLDFSHVQEAAIQLINHKNRIFTFGSNNALLEFLLDGTPRVKEYLVDSRKEVDKQLKLTCEEFISHATNILVGNLVQFIQNVQNFQKISQNDSQNKLSLKEQIWAKPEQISKLINDAQKNMKIKIPEIQKSMQLYLSNRETEFILFRPIKNNVLNVFMNIETILSNNQYTSEEILVVACPSSVQIGVLISSVSLTSENEKNSN